MSLSTAAWHTGAVFVFPSYKWSEYNPDEDWEMTDAVIIIWLSNFKNLDIKKYILIIL